MGNHPDGHLVYGYALGGGDTGFRIEDEVPEWLYEGYPAGYVEHTLLTASGWTEAELPGETREQWRARKKAANAALGIELVSHGYADYPEYILAAKVFTAQEGGTLVLSEDDLTLHLSWLSRLRNAASTLGIKPTQQSPCWILTSYYG